MEVSDRGTAKMRLAPGGNVKPQTGPVTEEDAVEVPRAVEGVATSAMRAAGAIADVGAAARRAAGGRGSNDGTTPKTPIWVIACLALLGGGGSHIGLRSLLGPDPEVTALTARMDAIDKARAEADARIDATESAIADAEVTRVTEVRYLIDLSVKGFGQLGVERGDLPDVPVELAERYRATEVEVTRRKLFEPEAKPPAPAPAEPSRMPEQ
jgi:hypothetical protein